MIRAIQIVLCLFIISCQSEQRKTNENELPIQLADDPNILKKKEDHKPAPVCNYDNLTATLGIGLILVNTDRNSSDLPVDIFNDSLLQDKYVAWNYYEAQDPVKPVCTKYFLTEPDFIQFVYLKETAKSYQVLNGFNQIKYLPKVKAHKQISWQDHILTSFGIRRLTKEAGELAYDKPIRTASTENSKTIIFPGETEMLCPIEIKGDWVKIQYDYFYNLEPNKYEGQPCYNFIDQCKPAQLGWIKWREKNKILVDIFLTP